MATIKNNEVPAKKKTGSKLDRAIAWLHLWPSIVSGIIVVFVCLTGTIIVYNEEIMDFTAGDAKHVTELENAKRISHQEIMKNVAAFDSTLVISEFVLFKDPTRSIRLRTFNPKQRKLSMVYMNPYSGEIIKKDNSIHFFYVTAHLHAELLAGKAGGWIVAISTIVFVLSCITGLVLWWPKRWNKTTRKASFTIKWKARFKRFNYDLHNVYGFYSLLICLVLGTTGLIIFFHPLMNYTIKASGGTLAHLEEVLPKKDSSRVSKDMVPFAYQVLEKEYPNKQMISIWNFDQQKQGVFIFRSGDANLKSMANLDFTIYDRYSGEKIEVEKEYLQHEKTENTIWQLHMGQWWGWLGKLSTFLAGVVATSLPITGFLIWWGRRNKKSKKKLVTKTEVPRILIESN
ncbi:MAG TPA: PepSY-associated TM helix domain-containing protein [Niabella sp.]|nr:PepSY-associated TM helix domain-containing protein [Niabella sp.]HOZ95930.1 PepSY-associated TM helix domain-containing protein [Niabella sp.]HQW15842.1 PepSY-associated TM helix domain-containing protein [Niabella sp.]HQX20982.1 PepSY-associated TM helix domain-containing protein [Niabella sp.]HRB07203.1 PepSY-associated TM helix domain-containing protein [Niabella sp.]